MKKQDLGPAQGGQHSFDVSTQGPTAASGKAWMIGEYRIIRMIGQGGMGVVYEAEQQHPRRLVALKVIRSGSYIDEHAVKLFQREAQALARLKHPGIAAIYEAGRTEQGEHFFAMEMVRGVPLQEHFKSKGPEEPGTPDQIGQRLRLFCRICEAVNYAHQRGVIHRDLKPSNILVSGTIAPPTSGSTADPVPEVKVLDFGLARITDTDVAVTTVMTEAGHIQGTLAYMSPEQARGNPDEIDLRSDVYSLGIILFELLTGRLPYDVIRAGPLEAVRIICEEPVRIGSPSESDGPDRVGRLDRDLQTILLKALEKEPWRRYQSALALAEDIHRFQANQPILARPPSTVYQICKLVARHKATFAFATSLVLLIISFAVTMAVQSSRIARERDKAVEAEKTATQVSSFLVDLFRTADPTGMRGSTITAREILDRGSAQIRQDLSAQPLVQAGLMDTLGRVYVSLGLFDQAQPLLETALATRRKLLGEDNIDVASSLVSTSTFWFHKGEFAKAKPMLERALSIREKLLGPDDLAVAACLHNLGNLHFGTGSYEEGQPLLERALEIRERKLASDAPDIATTLNSLGAIALRKGEMGKARQLWERTLAIREKVLGPEHPHVAQSLNNLAIVHTETGDAVGARPLLERVVRIQEKRFGPEHPDIAFAFSNLGDALLRLRDHSNARDCYQRAVKILEAATPNHPELGRFLAGLGRTHHEMGDTGTAREFFKRSLAIREKNFGENHPETAASLIGLANCDRQERRYASAEALFDRALALCRGPDGQYKARAAEFLQDYAALLRETGRGPRAAEIEELVSSLQKRGQSTQ